MPRSFDAILPTAPRRRALPLAASLAVHLLLVAALIRHGEQLWHQRPVPGERSPFGIGGGGGGRGGEGNRVAYITLPPAGPAEVARATPEPVRTRPTVVTRAVVPTPVVPKSVPTPPIEVPGTAPALPDTTAPDSSHAIATTGAVGGVDAPGAGLGTGGGAGNGQGPGSGTGRGPGSGRGALGGGEGASGTAPEPRQLVLPPDDVPKELRGQSLRVTFWVASDGLVQRVAVAPSISNGKFARKFEDTMRNYRFRPARSAAGFPVAGSTTLTVAFY